MATFSALMVLAYLLGSVPSGLLLARYFAGVDVREQGSGNIGATNVTRVVGKSLGVLTLLADALKGFIPTALALWLLPSSDLAGWVALAALLGHCFSVYLRFRGGKGVAVALGDYLVLAPRAVFVALGVWVLVVALSRKSSLGALLAAPVLLGGVWFFPEYRVYGWVTGIVLVVIVFKHRDNIKRLKQGREL